MRPRWLCAVVLGCGAANSPNIAPVDGASSAPDAPIDSQPPTVGTIRVTLISGTYQAQQPIVGDNVLFTDLDQTQVVMTDANGQASATVTGPTSITHVHYWNPTYVEARTILAALPGDDLVLRNLGLDYTSRASLTVNFPQTGASYSVCGPCDCGSVSMGPVALPMTEYCQSNPANVTLIAFQSNVPTSYATGAGAYDRGTGGTVTLPSQLTPCTQYTGTFTNISSPVTEIVFDFTAGITARKTFASPGSTVSGTVPGWAGQPARFLTTFLNANGGGEYQFTIRDVDATTTGESLDVGNWLLPWLAEPTLDTSTRRVNVPIVANGATGDLFVATFGYARQAGGSVNWTVFGAAPDNFFLPDIPPAVADMTPGTSVGAMYSFVVASESIGSYAEARRDPYRLWKGARVPGSGTIRMSASPNAQNP